MRIAYLVLIEYNVVHLPKFFFQLSRLLFNIIIQGQEGPLLAHINSLTRWTTKKSSLLLAFKIIFIRCSLRLLKNTLLFVADYHWWLVL